MMTSRMSRNKKNLGDIGEFLILVGLSTRGINDKELWVKLIEEYIARQVYWVIDKNGGRFN